MKNLYLEIFSLFNQNESKKDLPHLLLQQVSSSL